MMAISGVSGWLVSYVGDSIDAPAWQLAVAAVIAAVALPRMIGFARGFSSKPLEERFHVWIIDGKEVDFYLTRGEKVQLEVIRRSDKRRLFRSGHIRLPEAYGNLPATFKKESLKEELMPIGWQEDGAPRVVLGGERVHTWILEDQSISLLGKGDALYWKCEVGMAAHWMRDVRPGNVSKNKRVNDLIKSCSPLKWDDQANSPVIGKKTSGGRDWLFDHRRVRVVIRGEGEEPRWELLNRVLRTTSWVLVDPNILNDYAKGDRISRIGCQEISPQSVISSRKIENLFLVTKVNKASRFDPSQIVDSDAWAVTLVDAGSSQDSVSTWGGHAVIVVEGIEGRFPFTFEADLMPLGKGKARVRTVDLPDSEEIPCSGRTGTFLLNRCSVKKMMAEICRERDESLQTPLPFDLRGIDAINLSHTRAHNCISWAREKLAIAGLESTPGLVALIAAFPKQYTKFR